jgi:hypothetical protein
MAGGYITDDGFVEDETQKTAVQELSLDSVCGGATLLSAGSIETKIEKTTDKKGE